MGSQATVETMIYCAPESIGKGIGRRPYSALFGAVTGEDIHRIAAGYALPNPGSEALHKRWALGRSNWQVTPDLDRRKQDRHFDLVDGLERISW
jgi:L-amino acid N-acyltransferase YncA